jgi:anthranilate phosphoribosyltransferase
VSHKPLKSIIERLCAGESLSADECAEQFDAVMKGDLSDIELTAFLIALKAKGERPAEITGAATALRAAARPFPDFAQSTVDTCGTGGDGLHTVNISTAVAFIAAEAGLYVTKHGNRSISSKCGSADVLEACGIELDIDPKLALECLKRERFCFLFAPSYHSGMRHAMPVRRALKTRTIFNLLGPLVNPSRPHCQVLGVYDPKLCQPIAETLRMLGCRSALVVHGSGMDEIAAHGPTLAVRLHQNRIEELILEPGDVGLAEYPVSALKGGEPAQNAVWFRSILGGHGSPAHKSAIALNAGALLWISGQTDNWRDGVDRTMSIIDAGQARERLERVGALSRGA